MRWIPLILYSAFIFYMSSAPVPAVTNAGIPGTDKVLHVGAFALWGFLFAWALMGRCRKLPRLWFVVIVTVAGTLYGLTDEIHQSFVAERVADPWDLAADLAGSLLGGCVAIEWRRRRRNRKGVSRGDRVPSGSSELS